MIEARLIEELNNRLSNPIYAMVPATPPKKFHVLQKTGSRIDNKITESTIAIQSYSSNSLLEAIELNEAVKSAMFDLISCDDISAVYLNSDYNYTDSTEKRYRYQAVFVITHY